MSDGRQERQFELADGKVSHLCWRRAVSVSSSLCIPEVLFKPQDMLGFEADEQRQQGSTGSAGASLLASCPGFIHVMDMWITMEDYEERGPEVVHKKCF